MWHSLSNRGETPSGPQALLTFQIAQALLTFQIAQEKSCDYLLIIYMKKFRVG